MNSLALAVTKAEFAVDNAKTAYDLLFNSLQHLYQYHQISHDSKALDLIGRLVKMVKSAQSRLEDANDQLFVAQHRHNKGDIPG
jgi:hypothetical protein